jgi:MFS transporter, putative metabolite:H+ symporter
MSFVVSALFKMKVREMPMTSIGARLDRLPISKFHYRILRLVGLGMFFDGFDIYMVSGILAVLAKTGWSTVQLNALFLSVGFFGLTIGALLSGIVGDSRGRKFMYQTNLLIFSVATLLSAFAPNPYVLIVLRFFAGLGLGGEIVTGYSTLSEFVPANRRGRWQSLLALITNLSLPLSAILSLLVIPHLGWRWMFVIAGVPTIFIWWLRRTMPESPRWFESRGDYESAEREISKIEQEIIKETGKNLPEPSAAVSASNSIDKGSFSDLFVKKILPRTFIAIIMLMIMNSVVYGFTAWIPTIFIKDGITVTTSLAYNAVILSGAPIGALVAYVIVDRMGRKGTTVILSLAGAILAYLYGNSHAAAAILTLGFFLLVIMYLLVAITFGMYVPELFPTNIRLRGVGLANAFGRVASIGIPYLISYIVLTGSTNTVLLVISSFLILQAILVGIFGIETKQKSLESISNINEETPAEIIPQTHL